MDRDCFSTHSLRSGPLLSNLPGDLLLQLEHVPQRGSAGRVRACRIDENAARVQQRINDGGAAVVGDGEHAWWRDHRGQLRRREYSAQVLATVPREETNTVEGKKDKILEKKKIQLQIQTVFFI